MERREGMPAADLAQQVVDKFGASSEALVAALAAFIEGRADKLIGSSEIASASRLGLKVFFTEQLVLGSIVVPAVDAVLRKLKA